MDTQQAARELEGELPAEWRTETDGPKIYAYPDRHVDEPYGDDGPNFSATVRALEFGQGWDVVVSGGNPGFHGPLEDGEAPNLAAVADFITRTVEANRHLYR